jgi:hypothetical protein
MTREFWKYKRLTCLPWYLVSVVLGITVIVLVSAAFATGFQHSWNVLIGVESPFHHEGRGLTVPLSFLGYVFVPVAISVAVVTAIASFTRHRLLSDAEANEKLRQIVHPAVAKYLEEVVNPQAGNSETHDPKS